MTPHKYSPLERMMHTAAFAVPAVQSVMADLEATLFRAKWSAVDASRPIFITALPRAGTTLLLKVLAGHDHTATHTYRDMPFVRSPLLWHALSHRFRQVTAPMERAHGDGLEISPDSPEAFEEALYLTAFKDHYSVDGIDLWRDLNEEFLSVFRDHMKRIILLRRGAARGPWRYLSKNNANIARVAALQSAFPQSRIVVPVRSPLAHAHSMLRQHRRFADIHRADPFARRYMRDIGHFEFGALHRPVQFPGLKDIRELYAPDQIEYWLAYWCCAYRHLQQHDNLIFVNYDRFVRNGQVGELLAALELPADAPLIEWAQGLLRPQTAYPEPTHRPDVLYEADALYEHLSNSAACLI